MSFFIVHEIQKLNDSNGGRIRLRSDKTLSEALAAALEKGLSALSGLNGISIKPLTGSVLFYYDNPEQRLSALRKICELDETPDEKLPAPALPEEEEEVPPGIFFPLFRFFVIRPFLPLGLRIASSVTGALPFLKKGAGALKDFKLSVDLLDASAIGVSLLMRDFQTVSVLTLLLGLGETLEYWTRRRSMDSLTESLALNVDNVWRLDESGAEISVPLSEVQENDLVVVRDGGSIPVDGVVEDGCAVVNQSSMTGEPLGVPRSAGASVYAGTVVEQGHLVIRVGKVGDGTRLRQVVAFIEESEALKASIQGKSEKLAEMAVPFTFGLAALVLLITRNPVRAASVLLVDYSCALKLATPLAVLASMREGARHGMAIKGGRYLEALNEADTLVFDKTGTLTNASPRVVEVMPAPGFERDEVLRTAACLEEHFPHPVARAVVHKAQEEGLQHEEEHAQVEYVVAHGVASTLYGKPLRVGSRHYLECDEGIDISGMEAQISEQTSLGRSLLYLAIDGRLAGVLAIADPLRPEAISVISQMRELGFKRILMLTGDDERTARAIAGQAGITEFRAQVMPTDKAQVVQELTEAGCKVLMVGDGINDAPALSASHVGVAMSDGTDLAREVANVLLTRPDLNGLVEARKLARSTIRRINFNFRVTMILNSCFLAGGLFSILQPGVSALLHNLTTLGVSLNAMRPHLRNSGAEALALEEHHA